jgi:UDP-N-acetylmuramate dehydrogenase
MMTDMRETQAIQDLTEVLGAALGPGRVRVNRSMARYTALRVGGVADLLVVVESVDQLRQAVVSAWERSVPCRVLGGGSNVLVSDLGIRGLVVLNRARSITFHEGGAEAASGVRAASGASFSTVARQSVARGLAGLEWAAGIPGTVGGAIVGNAGAWGGDVASVLRWATILEQAEEACRWPVERLEYGYRTSALKRRVSRDGQHAVVLDAQFALRTGQSDELEERVAEIAHRRKKAQPAGATCGSVFRNPAGDFAGRLIDSAGLKGMRVGGAEISLVHANFVVNHGDASASDVMSLIDRARQEVEERFDVHLELEIELLGSWEGYLGRTVNSSPAQVRGSGQSHVGSRECCPTVGEKLVGESK